MTEEKPNLSSIGIKRSLTVDQLDSDGKLLEIVDSTFYKDAPCRTEGKLKKFTSRVQPSFSINPPLSYVNLPNSDFRCSIPRLFNEAYTEGNMMKFSELLAEHCTEDVQFIHQYDGEQNPFGPNQRNLIGQESIIELYRIMIQSGPDMVNRMVDSRAHYDPKPFDSLTGLGGCSMVGCRIVGTMTRVTRVYEKQSDEIAYHLDPPLPAETVIKTDTSCDTSSAALTLNSTNHHQTTPTVISEDSDLEIDPEELWALLADEEESDQSMRSGTSAEGGKQEPEFKIPKRQRKSTKKSNIPVQSAPVQSFAIKPFVTPIAITQYDGIYSFEINAQHKIFRLGLLFSHTFTGGV